MVLHANATMSYNDTTSIILCECEDFNMSKSCSKSWIKNPVKLAKTWVWDPNHNLLEVFSQVLKLMFSKGDYYNPYLAECKISYK